MILQTLALDFSHISSSPSRSKVARETIPQEHHVRAPRTDNATVRVR